MTKQNFPPSLSRAPGISDSDFQREQALGQLNRSICYLPSKSQTLHPEEAAREPYNVFRMVTVCVSQKRQRGNASPASVAQQLKQISTRCTSLMKQLGKADKIAFEAMCDAAEDREIAKEEWLHVRVLLETMRDR